MIYTRANMFRAAHLMVSNEDTRYYLNGVYIQPHPEKGVILTATDGHRLISIWDELGIFDHPEPVIVKADKATLMAAKAGKKDPHHKIIAIDTGYVEVVENNTGKMFVRQGPGIIDGTFPDYTRVIPSGTLTPTDASFNPDYLYTFQEAAREINPMWVSMSIHSVNNDMAAPHFVRMPPCCVGVIMPLLPTHYSPYKMPQDKWW